MRSHFVKLRRNLKKNNLPVPKALVGIENEKFVRKRIMEEPYGDMMRGSPHRSISPSERSMMHSAAGLAFQGSRHNAAMSHRSHPKFRDDESLFIEAMIRKDSIPVRPAVDKNMDN